MNSVGGFYDESPKDEHGNMQNFRVTTHSSSKLFNDASGCGTVAGHKDTIHFLGDMLRGSFTQAHQRDRRTIPAIVEHLDWNAPKMWMGAMNAFDKIVEGKVSMIDTIRAIAWWCTHGTQGSYQPNQG